MENIKKTLTGDEKAEHLKDHTKPIASHEELAERGGVIAGYLRLVDFGDSQLIESKFRLGDLQRAFIGMMESDKDLARVFETSVKRFKMRQMPGGMMMDQLMEMMAERGDGECECDDCKAEREAKKDQPQEEAA